MGKGVNWGGEGQCIIEEEGGKRNNAKEDEYGRLYVIGDYNL